MIALRAFKMRESQWVVAMRCILPRLRVNVRPRWFPFAREASCRLVSTVAA